ncbi:MAG: His-Xaa-Ser system radical SAM maturase HxsB [Alphaproteobacteria bacterium]|nr:His-Xaa-Ser system radical SAM maturase HxsB [Alphaproteobacteria bacterium]
MIATRTIQLPKLAVQADKLGPFRFERMAGKVLLTADSGEWHFLSEDDFAVFLKGELVAGHPEYEGLAAKGFIRAELNPWDLAAKVRRKRYYVDYGPHLHVMITTLRCNQGCKYCHASRTDMDRVDTDMSPEVVKHAVEMAFQSTNPYICFEYTGGEPTVNMDAIKLSVEYSRELNKKHGKIVDHSVVTNMTWMTEENAEWLMDNGVLVCTSLDGPKDLHNWNRTWVKQEANFPKGLEPADHNAYDQVLHWIRYFNRRYVERGRDPGLWHVDALMTTTRKTMENWKDLVDLYVDLGLRNLKIRPLNPYGFATKTWRVIGYTMEEYLDFYAEVLDYILELNQQGVQIQEGTAAVFLKKMLTPDDPNYVDLRNPIGSGTGQIAYNFDGRVFPSDEGRMLAGMGSDFFQLGELGKSSYRDLVGHPTVRALVMASLLDGLPACHTCWNMPYCGVRPINNYMESGDLFAQRPNTPKCKEHMGIARLLFERIANDTDGKIEAVFRRWTINRSRDEDAA